MDKKNLITMDGWKTTHKKMHDSGVVEETMSLIEPEKVSLDRQLGAMVGELIVAVHLPTLSTDMLRTNRVIQVNEALTKEWEMLEVEYRALYGKGRAQLSKRFYENRDWYKENIEDKYLKDVLEIQTPSFNPNNLDEFMKGVEEVLWDCDCSHYRISGIGEFEEHSWYRTVILKRSIE